MPLFKRRRPSASDVERRIEAALDEIVPLLRMDGAVVELVSWEESSGTAVLRFSGDCPDCRMSVGIMRQGIEARLRTYVPEIRAVSAE